jgi:HlyD family secretion protein
VLEGLREGETIVSGTYQAIRDLKDGTKVKASTETAPADGEKAS